KGNKQKNRPIRTVTTLNRCFLKMIKCWVIGICSRFTAAASFEAGVVGKDVIRPPSFLYSVVPESLLEFLRAEVNTLTILVLAPADSEARAEWPEVLVLTHRLRSAAANLPFVPASWLRVAGFAAFQPAFVHVAQTAAIHDPDHSEHC